MTLLQGGPPPGPDLGRPELLRRLILATTVCAEWTADTLGGVRHGLKNLLDAASDPDSRRAAALVAGADQVIDVRTPAGRDAATTLDGQLEAYGRELPAGEERRLCRLVLDPALLAEVTGSAPQLVAAAERFSSATVEIELRRHQARQLFCHVTLAVSSHLPHQPDFRLPEPRAQRSDSMSAQEVRADLAFFEHDLRPVFERWLAGCEVRPVVFRVFGRRYETPAFVVAVPDELKRDPERVAAGLANAYLHAGEADLGVGASRFSGHIKVIRRLVATEPDGPDDRPEAGDRPRYLVIPEPLQPDDTSGADTRTLLGEQERAAAELLRTFIGIEASAAASLYELDRTFDRIGAHLEVYESVALQAADLWDALALHLSRRGSELRTTHRSLELLHNTLLQGVADLDQIATDIRSQMEYVDDVADRLRDRLDRAAAERPLGDNSVRDSITRGGYFDRLRELGRQRGAKAQNVQATYESLLGAMAHAFDERRARESDMVEKSGLPIGVAVGLLGLVTVLQTTFAVTATVGPDWQWAIRIACWVVGLGALLALVVIFVNVSRVSRLGSEDFDPRYRRVAGYLQNSATVVLNEFAEHPETDAAAWRTRDEQLARRFAECWDDAFAPVAEDPALDPGDLMRLRRRTESFCLRALLLAERPRDFSRYRLPMLTLLYRTRRSDMFVRPSGGSVTVVSDSEFRRLGDSYPAMHVLEPVVAGAVTATAALAEITRVPDWWRSAA